MRVSNGLKLIDYGWVWNKEEQIKIFLLLHKTKKNTIQTFTICAAFYCEILIFFFLQREEKLKVITVYVYFFYFINYNYEFNYGCIQICNDDQAYDDDDDNILVYDDFLCFPA